MSQNTNTISQYSGGPTVDALELKLSGGAHLEDDLKRGQEVEIIARGTIVGHAFDDKRDGDGNVILTVKGCKLKVDELLGVTELARRGPQGQTRMTVDGSVVDAATDEPIAETETVVVDAEVVEGGEEVKQLPSGIDPGTGQVGEAYFPPEDGEAAEPAPEPELERHPQVPEREWDALSAETKAAVAGLVATVERNATAAAEAANATDAEAFDTYAREGVSRLSEEFGIELLPADEVEALEPPPDEPVPDPVSAETGPVGSQALTKRKAYLASRGPLPPEAAQARAAEVAEIDRRLAAQTAEAS